MNPPGPGAAVADAGPGAAVAEAGPWPVDWSSARAVAGLSRGTACGGRAGYPAVAELGQEGAATSTSPPPVYEIGRAHV